LEHLHLLLEEIDDLSRDCQFAPYGIAMTKRVARTLGINPIWYTDITPAAPGQWRNWLMNEVNALVDQGFQYVVDRRAGGDHRITFGELPIGRLAPFIDQMGSGVNAQTGVPYRKEFWWEREWRIRGPLTLPDQLIVIAPVAEHQRFRDLAHDPPNYVAKLIDASWGLEEIIGHLAGFDDHQIGPF
jgi:hypothetical protein